MARDGAGNFTSLYNWEDDRDNSIPITASRFQADNTDKSTALTNSLDRSAGGGGDILRNVGMTNNKFTSLGTGSALTDSVNYGQIQNGKATYFGATLGTSTAYTLSPSPSINAYDTGLAFKFKVSLDSGASPTMNISTKGAKSMKKYNKVSGAKVDIEALDLQTGIIYNGVYDGTDIVVYETGIVESQEFNSLEVNNNLQVNKKLNTQPNETTISSGEITYTGTYMIVETEGAVALDDLTTINGGSQGDLLLISPKTAGNVINILDNSGGGNIETNLNLDFKIDKTHGDNALFYFNSSGWIQIARNVYNDFLAGSGYSYLPNAKLLQWGYYSGGAFAPTITFPITFDSLSTVVGNIVTDLPGTLAISVSPSPSVSSFKGRQYEEVGGTLVAGIRPFYWYAVGTKAI